MTPMKIARTRKRRSSRVGAILSRVADKVVRASGIGGDEAVAEVPMPPLAGGVATD
jgi:phosphatidylglycerophosphate synthase